MLENRGGAISVPFVPGAGPVQGRPEPCTPGHPERRQPWAAASIHHPSFTSVPVFLTPFEVRTRHTRPSTQASTLR
jgi:hypothetical protein